ncbi:MAG: hypothetical protein EBS18_05930 [Actinobacteria bacterium]|nr:hypothetical protein [Actinomycetota bacterium]
MSQVKISPDEKITMNALDSADPFARQGRSAQPLNQHIPKKQRDFSHYDEPEEKKPEVQKFDIPEEPKMQKRGRKPKQVLESVEEYQNPIIESRNNDGMPSYRCEFAGRDIFVGFPCYKTTNPVTAFALLAMALDFGKDRIRFDMSIGDAMIYHSRNKIAQKFLETDAKWLLMIDDDIIPCIGRPLWMRSTVANARTLPDAPLQRHVLQRLIGSGKTLIGGAYFGRQQGAPLMCSDRSLEPKARAYQDEVAPVDWVATGCMLVHRKVFQDIEEKFPELKSPIANGEFDFFHPINSKTGEDVSFCKRAKEAGHQPHIDLGLPVFHVGYACY